MSRIKGKDTKPEMKARSLLHRAGFRFRVHSRLLPGKPDIVLPKYKTAIFIHGCYWHRHLDCRLAYFPKSNIEFWSQKFDETIRRDANKEYQLRLLGWKVLIIWECELKTNPLNVMQKVMQTLKSINN